MACQPLSSDGCESASACPERLQPSLREWATPGTNLPVEVSTMSSRGKSIHSCKLTLCQQRPRSDAVQKSR